MRSGGELVYLGCYTGSGGGRGEGVVLARRDPATGALPRSGHRGGHRVPLLPGPASRAAGALRGQRARRRAGQRLAVRPGRGADPAGAYATPAARALPPGGRPRTGGTCCGQLRRRQRRGASPRRRRASPASAATWCGTAGTARIPQRQERAARHMVSPDAGRAAAARRRSRHRLGLPATCRPRHPAGCAPRGPAAHCRPAPGPGTWPGTRTGGAASSPASWTARSPRTS